MANLFSSGAPHIHINPQFCSDSACCLVCQWRLVDFSGRLVSSGINDVVITSVHSEKTRLLKKLMNMMMVIIIMKKFQETIVFSSCQKLTSAMKLKPEE